MSSWPITCADRTFGSVIGLLQIGFGMAPLERRLERKRRPYSGTGQGNENDEHVKRAKREADHGACEASGQDTSASGRAKELNEIAKDLNLLIRIILPQDANASIDSSTLDSRVMAERNYLSQIWNRYVSWEQDVDKHGIVYSSSDRERLRQKLYFINLKFGFHSIKRYIDTVLGWHEAYTKMRHEECNKFDKVNQLIALRTVLLQVDSFMRTGNFITEEEDEKLWGWFVSLTAPTTT